jgi:hypothetical protein
MREVKVISDQNIIDFVLQYTGSTEGLFTILAINSGLGVNSTLKQGDIINVPDEIANVNVLDYYKRNEVIVVTGELELFGDFNIDFNNDFSI